MYIYIIYIYKQWYISYMKDIERLPQRMKTHETLIDICHWHQTPSHPKHLFVLPRSGCAMRTSKGILSKSWAAHFPNTFLDDLGEDLTDSKVNSRLLDPVEVPYRNPKNKKSSEIWWCWMQLIVDFATKLLVSSIFTVGSGTSVKGFWPILTLLPSRWLTTM